ncbi:Lrp/AsnC family transcriptional regulator [Candidatus Woesearchaeota archaeon]|nr:Lrp/AsnC family transcriptional regulator [Candidatus Woesearchaeota archaeon]
MLDKKNLKIISALKKNSRDSIRDISKKTNLRPSTVHLRIRKLVKDNIIEKFTIKTNDKLLKENFIVFILVNTEKNIPDILFNNKNIKDVFGITGEYDLIMKCKFSGIEEFNRFILELRKLPQVKKTLTMVGTTKIKEEI